MKTQLSSLEIAALVKELQVLVDSKIDQIYQTEQKDFLISVHVPRKGKHFLRIQLPGFIYLTDQKMEMPPPSEFCLNLRKNLNNSLIRKFRQLGSERIIEITLQKDQQFKLIVELFSKGNLILTDSQNQILVLLEKQRWVERELKIKTVYLPPPLSFDYSRTNFQELKQKIKQSKKSKLVTCLATEIGLGGVYAEEICLINNLDKSQKPQDMTDNQIKLIFKSIKDFLKNIELPQGFVYEFKDITPFELKIYRDLNKKKFSTYNQALDSVFSKKAYQLEKEKKESQYQEKIKKINHIIKEQEQTIKKLQQQEQIATQKANHLYEKYQEIFSLLNKVKQAKQKLSWDEIKKELKKHKQVKQVDLKEKKIIIQI